MANYVVGKIINMHGIKGEFKVYPEVDDIELFNELPYVLIKGTQYEIENARPHKGCVLLKVKGIDSINDGEKYKNQEIEIPEELAPSLDEDEFYIRDLYDMNVYDDNDNYIGVITEVMFTKSNDVFEVTMDNNKKIYIPYIEDCVLDVNVQDKKMTIKLMEGLI